MIRRKKSEDRNVQTLFLSLSWFEPNNTSNAGTAPLLIHTPLWYIRSCTNQQNKIQINPSLQFYKILRVHTGCKVDCVGVFGILGPWQ